MTDKLEKPKKAIGHRDTMKPEEMAGKHIDGPTGYVFATEEDYIEFSQPHQDKPGEAKEGEDGETPTEQ